MTDFLSAFGLHEQLPKPLSSVISCATFRQWYDPWCQSIPDDEGHNLSGACRDPTWKICELQTLYWWSSSIFWKPKTENPKNNMSAFSPWSAASVFAEHMFFILLQCESQWANAFNWGEGYRSTGTDNGGVWTGFFTVRQNNWCWQWSYFAVQVTKRLEQTAAYFKRLGALSFWGQLVCTTVAAVILAFSIVVTGAVTAPATLYLTAAGIAAAFLSVFWSFGYMRLAQRLRATAHDPAKVQIAFEACTCKVITSILILPV